jgi:hypothetical protein
MSLGVFSDNVRKYFEHGLITIPCKDKRPVLGKEWERFCNEAPTEEMIEKWELKFPDINQLGLTMGKATMLSAFDFDYEFHPKATLNEKDFAKDKRLIERQILAILPPSPAIKTGKKGWTRFFKSHGELENAQCDRNGIRAFDFLARNKQTIIPPSIYSDESDMKYRWMGPPLEECMDDVPYITQGIVDEIKFLFGEKIADTSRHGKLFQWVIRQLVIDKGNIKFVAEKLMFYDKNVNEIPYLTDKKHFPKVTDPMANAINWVTRIEKWRGSKPAGQNYDALKSVQNSREMYFQFFNQALGTHKKDLLSGRLMKDVVTETKHNTKTQGWKPVANMIPDLRSDIMEIGLRRELVEDHLAKYQQQMKPELLLEIPVWDGVDRIAKICTLCPAVNIVPHTGTRSFMKHSDGTVREIEVGHDYETGIKIYTEITKDIAAGIFRRAFDSMEQNLFTIIRGPQGAGKNTFIEKLYGIPFRYYSAEVNIGMDMAKNYDAVEGRLVCIIGEFDQTQKVQISFLKELITNASFTARRAYERASDKYELKQTFFSACNFDNVLKDSSGNRRFVIYDIPLFNMDYFEHVDSGQLLAQYFHLYKSGFRMSDESKAWIKKFNEGERPEDPMNLALQDYIESVKNEHRMNMTEWLTNAQVSKIISNVCNQNGVPPVRFRQELNRRKLTKRSDGMKYLNLARHENSEQMGFSPS